MQEEVQAGAAAAEAHAPTKEHEEVILPEAAEVHGKVVQTDALQLSSAGKLSSHVVMTGVGTAEVQERQSHV